MTRPEPRRSRGSISGQRIIGMAPAEATLPAAKAAGAMPQPMHRLAQRQARSWRDRRTKANQLCE